MKLIFAITTLALGAIGATAVAQTQDHAQGQASETILWLGNLELANQIAKKSGKPILAVFR